MMNFYQFWDKLNGKPYENVPEPTPYAFNDYVKDMTKTPVNGTENGTWDLMPLTQDDMKQAASDDVADHIEQLRKSGHNPTRLGKPMTDEEFAKFYGKGW